MSIGQRSGQLVLAMSKIGGGSGSAPPPPPAVPVLTAPSNGATISNGVAVTVSATSTDGDLDRIDWILDGSTVVATDSVAPYSQSWTPSGLANGAHTLVARAVRAGQTTDSTAITINVGAVAPAVPVLTAPTAGANVFNTVAVTVSATSTDGDLTRIDWVLDPGGSEVVVATDSTAPYSASWTPTGISDGNHLLVARAVRGGLTTDSASITIHVGEVLHKLVSSVTCLRAWQSDFGVHDDGSGKCDSWTDQKNGGVLAQATSTKRPAIATGVNGHPKLTFDANDDVLQEATLDLSAPGGVVYFIWGIFSHDTWGATRTFFSMDGNGVGRIGDLTSTPNMALSEASNGPLNNGAALGSLVRCEAQFSASTGDYLKLGTVTAAGTNVGNSNPAAGVCVGGLTSAALALGGSVYVCLLFQGAAPSGAELAALSAAAAAMYPGVLV